MTRSSSAAAGAQNEHGRPDLAVANLFENLQAVHIGQHEVENDQVVIGGVDVFDAQAPGGRDIDSVAGALKTAAKKIGDALFVLDDQNSHLFLGYQRAGQQTKIARNRTRPQNSRFRAISGELRDRLFLFVPRILFPGIPTRSSLKIHSRPQVVEARLL